MANCKWQEQLADVMNQKGSDAPIRGEDDSHQTLEKKVTLKVFKKRRCKCFTMCKRYSA